MDLNFVNNVFFSVSIQFLEFFAGPSGARDEKEIVRPIRGVDIGMPNGSQSGTVSWLDSRLETGHSHVNVRLKKRRMQQRNSRMDRKFQHQGTVNPGQSYSVCHNPNVNPRSTPIHSSSILKKESA